MLAPKSGTISHMTWRVTFGLSAASSTKWLPSDHPFRHPISKDYIEKLKQVFLTESHRCTRVTWPTWYRICSKCHQRNVHQPTRFWATRLWLDIIRLVACFQLRHKKHSSSKPLNSILTTWRLSRINFHVQTISRKGRRMTEIIARIESRLSQDKEFFQLVESDELLNRQRKTYPRRRNRSKIFSSNHTVM